MQIINDHKSEKVSKIGAQLTKLSEKQFGQLHLWNVSQFTCRPI